MSSDPKLPNKILRRERELRGWTLQYVADQLYKLCEKEGRESNISADIVGRWERGTNIPQLHYQAKLCRLYRKSTTVELGFVEQQVGSVLPPSDPHASQGIPHSRVSSVVSRAFDEQDQNSAHAQPVATQQPFILEEGNTKLHEFHDTSPEEYGLHKDRNTSTREEDWGEAPHVEQLYGRDKELLTVEQWIVDNSCRIVALLGIGGIGKTSLAMAATSHMKEAFAFVFWRSLQNAPLLKHILRDCIHLISLQRRTDLPESEDDQITLLLQYFREHRCLLVLDNVETVLQSGKGTGSYREGYEGYGRLVRRIGEAKHQSCLLLTSREKPDEVAFFEGSFSPVRSHTLEGLTSADGRAILRDKGLYGEEQDWEALVNHYGGNPLSLKLVSQFIREIFDGNIAGFLADGEMLLSDVYAVLDQQFERLSTLEQEIIYWLAIEREPVSLKMIQSNMVRPVVTRMLQEALRSLRRRDFIEISHTGFVLQNVVMEFVTDRFVDGVYEEITSEAMMLFESHPLIKAQAKEYVRESQTRLILQPVAQRLLATFGKEDVEKMFTNILTSLRSRRPQRPSYAAGNVLNLLVHGQSDLRGYDFSQLMVRQAWLQEAMLPEVNFAQADLATSVFADTFGSILSLAMSPNGNVIAAGTSNGEIWVWDGASGTPLQTFQAHTDWVRSIVFNADGSIIASSSNDQTVRLWEVDSGRCLMTLHGHINRVWSVAFSPDGTTIASGGDDQLVRVWEVSSGECLKRFQGPTHRINALVFSTDGGTIATGSEDQTVRLWDVSNGECLMTLKGHTGWIRSVAFSPDGKTIASGSSDQTVRVWKADDGQCLETLRGHTGWVYSVAFNSDGSTIVSGSADHTVRLWETRSGRCLKVLQGHSGWVRSTAYGPDGSVVVSGSEDQTVRVWEVSSGRCLRTLRGYSKRITCVSMSGNGNVLASGGDDLCVWEVKSGRCLRSLQGHSSWVYSVAFSPDGSSLATGSSDHTVRLWDVKSGQCLKVLQGHGKCVWSVAFGPDGKTIASGSNDQTVRLWDVKSGQCLKSLQGHIGWVYSVAFSPDGSTVASGGDDQTVRVWDVKSDQCLQVLQGHVNRVWSVAFSPNGETIASGGDDQTVRVWDVKSGQCLKTLQGHTGWIRSVAFSPDESVVVSGSEDRTVRVWDRNSGQCLQVLQGHRSSVWSVAFSPDGNTVISGSDDGTLKMWNMRTWECLKMLRSDRPYERMDITGVIGVTEAQKAALKTLGALVEGVSECIA
jgi:WD40 repeat protein/transcriptional regulator with XRE-family HTH domain